MPWTVDDPPPPAKNWSASEKAKCVAAANGVLAQGGSDEQAIQACIAAAGKGRGESMKEQDVMRALRGKTLERSFIIGDDRRQVDVEGRTVDLAFSSEEPVERWFGEEILDHGSGSIRFERLNQGAALLVSHNHDDQVGVIENARLDKDRRARAQVRFSRSARGEEIFQDVNDGIRTLVSVGYRIHDAVLERTGDEGDAYRITDWEPYEISLVAVPADASVGVGRAAEFQPPARSNTMTDETRALDDLRMEDPPGEESGGELIEIPELDEAARAAAEARAAADAEIRRLAGEFRRTVPDAMTVAEQVIDLDGTVEEFKRKLKETWLARKPEPVPVVTRQPRLEMRLPMRAKQMVGFPNTREGMEDAYRMGKWARAALFGDPKAARWCKDYGVRVMTTSDFTGGGAVVPEEMSQAIIDLREQYGVARRYCFIHPMDSDATTIPRRKTGTTAYFVGQTEATTESDKGWDQVGLNARELSALTRLSRSYAEDAVIDVAMDVAQEHAYAFAVKEDECLFNGDGTSTYGGIYGIRAKIIDGTHTAGAIDAAAGHDTFAEIDADDLLSVSGGLPGFAGIVPRWYASKKAISLTFDALKVAAGGNTIQSLSGDLRNTWLRDEVVESESMPSAVTDISNTAMLVYGDLRMGSTMGDRRGFAMQVLQERYAEYRQIGILAWERFDIVVHGLGDNTNAGPIVALIGE